MFVGLPISTVFHSSCYVARKLGSSESHPRISHRFPAVPGHGVTHRRYMKLQLPTITGKMIINGNRWRVFHYERPYSSSPGHCLLRFLTRRKLVNFFSVGTLRETIERWSYQREETSRAFSSLPLTLFFDSPFQLDTRPRYFDTSRELNIFHDLHIRNFNLNFPPDSTHWSYFPTLRFRRHNTFVFIRSMYFIVSQKDYIQMFATGTIEED